MSSRLLYYDFGMNADDDWYAEWFTVMRMTWASEQDLHVLKANWLVHVFDENVLIVLDRKENNYIQKDRYTPSKYLSVYSLDTICIQDVSNLDTQVRIGKERLGEVREGKERIDYTSKEEPTAIEGFWKPDVNKVIEVMKQSCSDAWLQYMPWKMEREFAKHILSKKLASEIEKYNMPLEVFINNIIKLSAQPYMKQVNTPQLFYQNWWMILNAGKLKLESQDEWKRPFYNLNS